MACHPRAPYWFALPALLFALLTGKALVPSAEAAGAPSDSPGSLEIIGKGGKVAGICPLKHTDVRAAISGFVARVTVTQEFHNPSQQNIEAVYVFPLPENAAVDDMTIQIGDRTVRGLIKQRDEARAIYEKAKSTGHVAALLDQERPNIFTQSVANILPGEQVTVTISYLQTLEYESGTYTFSFPMVVGPRYIPGNATGKQAGGWAPDTDKVPDASRISPPVTPEGTRTGHDISLELAINAGVPIQKLHSTLHKVDIAQESASTATVKLRNQAEIPNRDFILKYEVAGAKIEDAVLSEAATAGSKAGPGGYFTLILQPPAQVAAADVTPKELVFVLDTSGSMGGFPIDKGKELINRALDQLYPGDTFNLITFSGDTRIVFPEPVYPTAENLREAKAVLDGSYGGGGTEMMKAIRTALEPSDHQDHVRIVCFVTDGFVGNDLEILGEIQKHPNARVFAFGIGDSVNRFLIEGMAKAGRGDAEVVTLHDKAAKAADRLYERLRSPMLTDISIDWGGLPVTDVYPRRLPDLFSGKPLVVTGRYTSAAKGMIRLYGTQGGEKVEREIPVTLTAEAGSMSVLPSFWARRKIVELMSQDWAGLQSGSVKPEVQKEITQLGLDYRLMTQFTSFVAVEEQVVTKDGKPQRVEVPVEMPKGVSYEGIFGNKEAKQSTPMVLLARPGAGFTAYGGVVGGVGSGSGSGVGYGSGGGIGPGVAAQASGIPGPPPASPMYSTVLQKSREDDRAKIPPPFKKPTGERAVLESKLHPTLLGAFDCWKESGEQCKAVQNGRVRIQIFVTGDMSQLLEQLKSLDFEPATGQSVAKAFVGSLPIDKLLALARVSAVRFVVLHG